MHWPKEEMKTFIKKIDSQFLNNSLRLVYRFFYATILTRLNKKTITPLPKKISQTFSLAARFEFFKKASYFLRANRIDGVYAEFGSHEVNTFRMSLRTLGLPNMPNKIYRFYAFDSFEGMPEPEGIDKQKIWRHGMNFTSKETFLNIVKKDLHRVVAVKGFYNESLPTYDWPQKDVIALAYIDCDYYSSTKDCLAFIKDKLQHGSLLAFDDWNCYYSDPKRGQRLAFSEFEEEIALSHQFVELCDIASGGRCFVVLEKEKIGTDAL